MRWSDLGRALLLMALLALAWLPVRYSHPPVPKPGRECILIGGLAMGCRAPVYANPERRGVSAHP